MGAHGADSGRAGLLARRLVAHGLDRAANDPLALAVLDLGVPDTGSDAARLALSARLADGRAVPPDLIGPGAPLALVWSWRASPHVHRRAALPALAAATAPLSDADALARLGGRGTALRRTGRPAREVWQAVVPAVRAAAAGGPVGKGALSGAVTPAADPALRMDCRSCGAVHVSDLALRPATLWAGLELEPGTNPPVAVAGFAPRAPDPAALTALVRAAVALGGPVTAAEVAEQLDVRRADLAGVWPDGLVAVDREGVAAWAVPDAPPAGPAGPVVALLAPFDPWLQQRDRSFLVPDPAVRTRLWPTIGRPGALLVDGEVAATWRARTVRGQVAVTLDPVGGLEPWVRDRLDDEVARVAGVRGLRPGGWTST